MKQAIKNKIDELFKATPDNVGVGWGKKMKGGKYTEELCIVFGVEQKKPLDELKRSEILPPSVEIEGHVYKTDVIEVGKMRTFVSCYPSIAGDCTGCNNATAVPCFQTWCPDYYDPDDPLNNWTYHIDNQDRQTFLSGGIQISSNNNFPVGGGSGMVGTLGMIAIDNFTGALVGVTNNHVVVGNPFYATERLTNSEESEADDNVYQNYSAIGYEIGKVMRYMPLMAGIPNSVDGAIFSVDSSVIDLTESYKQFGLSYTSAMDFASTVEIDNLLSTNPLLYSSGRTTGPKEGALCGLVVRNVPYSANIGPYFDGGIARYDIPFNNLILFSRTDYQCPYPSAEGDSGAVLIADFSGTWKIIGLILGGSEFFGLACRIDEVAAQLDISAWNGLAAPYIDVNSQEIITGIGRSALKVKLCNEKTYWQIGIGTYSNPC